MAERHLIWAQARHLSSLPKTPNVAQHFGPPVLRTPNTATTTSLNSLLTPSPNRRFFEVEEDTPHSSFSSNSLSPIMAQRRLSIATEPFPPYDESKLNRAGAMIWNQETYVHDVCGRYDAESLLHFRKLYHLQIAKFKPDTITWMDEAPLDYILKVFPEKQQRIAVQAEACHPHMSEDENEGGVAVNGASASPRKPQFHVPDKQPIQPPALLKAQKLMGFRREINHPMAVWLRNCRSPTNRRITAGGDEISVGSDDLPETFTEDYLNFLIENDVPMTNKERDAKLRHEKTLAKRTASAARRFAESGSVIVERLTAQSQVPELSHADSIATRFPVQFQENAHSSQPLAAAQTNENVYQVPTSASRTTSGQLVTANSRLKPGTQIIETLSDGSHFVTYEGCIYHAIHEGDQTLYRSFQPMAQPLGVPSMNHRLTFGMPPPMSTQHGTMGLWPLMNHPQPVRQVPAVNISMPAPSQARNASTLLRGNPNMSLQAVSGCESNHSTEMMSREIPPGTKYVELDLDPYTNAQALVQNLKSQLAILDASLKNEDRAWALTITPSLLDIRTHSERRYFLVNQITDVRRALKFAEQACISYQYAQADVVNTNFDTVPGSAVFHGRKTLSPEAPPFVPVALGASNQAGDEHTDKLEVVTEHNSTSSATEPDETESALGDCVVNPHIKCGGIDDMLVRLERSPSLLNELIQLPQDKLIKPTSIFRKDLENPADDRAAIGVQDRVLLPHKQRVACLKKQQSTDWKSKSTEANGRGFEFFNDQHESQRITKDTAKDFVRDDKTTQPRKTASEQKSSDLTRKLRDMVRENQSLVEDSRVNQNLRRAQNPSKGLDHLQRSWKARPAEVPTTSKKSSDNAQMTFVSADKPANYVLTDTTNRFSTIMNEQPTNVRRAQQSTARLSKLSMDTVHAMIDRRIQQKLVGEDVAQAKTQRAEEEVAELKKKLADKEKELDAKEALLTEQAQVIRSTLPRYQRSPLLPKYGQFGYSYVAPQPTVDLQPVSASPFLSSDPFRDGSDIAVTNRHGNKFDTQNKQFSGQTKHSIGYAEMSKRFENSQSVQNTPSAGGCAGPISTPSQDARASGVLSQRSFSKMPSRYRVGWDESSVFEYPTHSRASGHPTRPQLSEETFLPLRDMDRDDTAAVGTVQHARRWREYAGRL